MRLTAIWTLPACTLREKIRRTLDWADQQIARRLPNRWRFHTFVQLGAAAIKNDETVPDVTYLTVLERIPGRPRS